MSFTQSLKKFFSKGQQQGKAVTIRPCLAGKAKAALLVVGMACVSALPAQAADTGPQYQADIEPLHVPVLTAEQADMANFKDDASFNKWASEIAGTNIQLITHDGTKESVLPVLNKIYKEHSDYLKAHGKLVGEGVYNTTSLSNEDFSQRLQAADSLSDKAQAFEAQQIKQSIMQQGLSGDKPQYVEVKNPLLYQLDTAAKLGVHETADSDYVEKKAFHVNKPGVAFEDGLKQADGENLYMTMVGTTDVLSQFYNTGGEPFKLEASLEDHQLFVKLHELAHLMRAHNTAQNHGQDQVVEGHLSVLGWEVEADQAAMLFTEQILPQDRYQDVAADNEKMRAYNSFIGLRDYQHAANVDVAEAEKNLTADGQAYQVKYKPVHSIEKRIAMDRFAGDQVDHYLAEHPDLMEPKYRRMVFAMMVEQEILPAEAMADIKANPDHHKMILDSLDAAKQLVPQTVQLLSDVVPSFEVLGQLRDLQQLDESRLLTQAEQKHLSLLKQVMDPGLENGFLDAPNMEDAAQKVLGKDIPSYNQNYGILEAAQLVGSDSAKFEGVVSPEQLESFKQIASAANKILPKSQSISVDQSPDLENKVAQKPSVKTSMTQG